MNITLLEKSRTDLVAKSKKDEKGLQRYKKRVKSRIAASVREYNRIDMNDLFKNNILNVAINVIGETDTYQVKISFGGFLDILKRNLRQSKTELDLRIIIKSLVESFNKKDLYVRCSCPDYQYRFGYQATKGKYQNGQPELIPANVRNPNNDLGSTCKHILLILSNTSWLIKVASVIFNYINWMKKFKEKQYAEIIHKTIYDTAYEKPVQLSLDDKDELETGEEDIDKSNIYAKKKTQFEPGNPYRYTKSDIEKNQTSMFDNLEDNQEEEEDGDRE